MKIIHLPLLAAIALLAGCNPSPTTTTVSKAESNQKALEQVQEEIKETAKAIQDYAHAQREDYAKAMKVAIADAEQELDQIAMKAKQSSAKVKAKAEPKIRELRQQISNLESQLESVGDASESTWNSVKNGFASAYESTMSGLNEARQWVSDTIDPEKTS